MKASGEKDGSEAFRLKVTEGWGVGAMDRGACDRPWVLGSQTQLE